MALTTLETQLSRLATALGQDMATLIATRGSLADLTTTAKTNLVSAINEVLAKATSAADAAASIIDDTASATSSTYSSDKIVTLLNTLKSDILGGASDAYDTLKELQDILTSDDTSLAALLTAVDNRVSYADVQVLTTNQQLQACSNIGIGDFTTDLATVYTTARGVAP